MVKRYFRFLLVNGFLATLAAVTNQAIAQIVPPVVVPPAPNAATLGAYGDVPVSPYVGQANVTIPLYTVETAQHKLNISLSYQGGGMRVEQEASWVGLGWALNAGGVITRSLRGNDDLKSDQNRQGFLYSAAVIPPCISDPRQPNYNDYDINSSTFSGNNGNNDVGYFNSACNSSVSTIDMQPDAFYYNFAGHSGQFSLKRPSNSVAQQPGAPLLVESLDKSENLDIKGMVTNTNGDAGWLITTAEGYKYYFFQSESTTLLQFPKNERLPSYVSSWYLTRIEAPNGEAILFEYTLNNNNTSHLATNRSQTTSFVTQMPQNGSNGNGCTGTAGTTGTTSDVTTQNKTETVGVILAKISFSGGTVSFASANRSDLLPKGGAVPKRITGLTVREGVSVNGRVVKQIDFQQSYFNATATGVAAEIQRLRLDKVTETNAGIAKPAHSFTYFETVSSNGLSLPSKLSKAQDYGGYFNGRFGNDSQDFLPQVQVNYTDQNNNPQVALLAGADRQPVLSFAKTGTLRSITYPTGGKTDFDYELHSYQDPNSANTAITACGLRIASVSSTSAETGAMAKTQRYTYTQSGSTVSSGRSMSDYVFAYSASTIPLPYTCPFSTNGYWYWNTSITRMSSSNAPLSTAAAGQNIGYDLVTMSEESTNSNAQTVYNGKVEYYYSNRSETQPNRYFPGIPNIVPQDNGQLLKQITYKTIGLNSTGNPLYQKLTELINTYTTEEGIVGKGIVCSPSLCQTPVAQSRALYGQGVRYYDIKWKWARLTTAITKIYDQSTESKFTTATAAYSYDNPVHRQVTKTVQTASDGALRTTYMRYPADYPNATGTIAAMATSLHQHTPVVETYSTVTRNGTEQVTAGQYTSFGFANPAQTLVRPQQIQTLRLAQSLALTTGTGSFTPAQFVLQSGGGYVLQFDGHYFPDTSLEYEADLGNVSMARKANDAPVAYQWGYAGQLPVAVFTNASRSQPLAGNPAIGNEASFLGFETTLAATSDPTTDYWAKVGIGRGVTFKNAQAHTGTGAFRVGEAVAGGAIPGPTRTFSPDGQSRRYRLSAWVKTESSAFVANAGRLGLAVKRGSNGSAVPSAGQELQFGSTNGEWVYQSVVVDLANAWQQLGLTPGAGGERLQIVATTTNVGGSTGNPAGFLIDDVRFEPMDAQTTTYTYNLVTRQPTSSSDANNRPVYYEYDNLQRLKLVRDHLGQIVKHFSYHYQKQ